MVEAIIYNLSAGYSHSGDGCGFYPADVGGRMPFCDFDDRNSTLSSI